MPEKYSKQDSLPKSHGLTLNGRRELSLFGVADILAFDSEEAELQTVMGKLTVEGEELKIGVLDTNSGEVTISGKISALVYREDGEAKRGFFKRRG